MGVKASSSDNDSIISIGFDTIFQNTKDMMFIKNKDLVYVAASEPFVKMVGKYCVDQVVGYSDYDIFEDKNLAKRYVEDDKKLMKKGINLVDYTEPITEIDGHARYGSTSKFILKNSTGEIIGILGVTRDITKEYMARQHYQQELKFLFELPEDTYAISYVDVDDWRIISQRRQNIDNGTLEQCNTVDELCEAAVASIVDHNCKAAEFYRDFTQENLRNIYHSGRSNMSFVYQRILIDGTKHWVRNNIRFLLDTDSGHLCVMLMARDIDAEKLKEQKLLEAAKMDKMTMLYNRETTMESIRKILSEYSHQRHVLFMLDVDNFKSLNDTLGHQAGDDFLVELANEIRKTFRENDVVGRIGGDEFFALMRNTDYNIIEKKASDLLNTVQDVCATYPDINLSGSIGISIYPDHGKNLEDLYAKADSALYEAKRKGKNQFVYATE